MISLVKEKLHNLISDKKFSEILTGSVWAVGARLAVMGLSLLSTIVVARVYGADSTGVLAMVNSFLTLASIVTVLGTGTSILRLIPEHIAKHSVTSAFHIYRKTQYVVAAVSIATGTFCYFASGIVADQIFHKSHLSLFFKLASGFLAFKSLMDLNTCAVRGLRLIRTFAFMQVIPSLTMLLVLLAGHKLFQTPNNPVYAQLAGLTVTAVAGAFIMDRSFKNRMQADDSVQQMTVRDILSISMPMMMAASMQFFVGQTGIVMLGMFRSESEVGYFSVAVKLATLTSFVLHAINTITAPKFSELYHTGKIHELFYVARKSSKLIFWITMPILLILILFGKPLLALLFGKNFVIAFPALVLLVIGQFVNSISGPTGNFMNMTGQQKIIRNIIFFSTMINIGLSLILIPRYGINGAAVGGMVSLIFLNIYSLVYIKDKFGRNIGYVPLIRIGRDKPDKNDV